MSFYRQCLKRELLRRKAHNPRYSMRAFAQNLDLSPSTLCRVLAGTRLPSRDTALRITKRLKLSQEESELFLLSASGYEDRTDSPTAQIAILNSAISDKIRTEIEEFQEALGLKYGVKSGTIHKLLLRLLPRNEDAS